MNITINPKKPLHEITILAKEAVSQAKIGKSQVVAVFDVSGSMSEMYRNGTVDALATRVLALGLELDDNGIIPVYALGDSCEKLTDLTKENLNGYTKNIKVGGGTNYSPTIDKIVKDAQEGDPMLVLLFTDGENYDTQESKKALIDASKLPIFFQWYGIYATSKPSFSFLASMDNMTGRVVDNAGFSPLGLKMNQEHSGDDDKTFYEDMLKEYQFFPKKAEEAGSKWGNKRRGLFGLF